jgi:5-methylcytosine-specific restriction endonuclease McrA
MKKRKGMRPVSDDYKKIKDKVKRRDKNTCQLCGYKGRNLEVHHILRYSDSILCREDIDNLILLCKNKCHKMVTGHEHRFAPLLSEIVQSKKKK